METSPQPKLNIRNVMKDLQPTIEKKESEDEILARLASYPEWEVLKGRIKSKIDALERITDNVEEVDDLELYGFKCLTKNILIDELEGIIGEVELTADVINKKKKNESGLETI